MKYQLSHPLSIHEMGQRQNQEDSIFPSHGTATADDRLFLLCDGMGGHERGEVASRIVCEQVSAVVSNVASPNCVFTDDMARAAMQKMYDVLDTYDTGEGKKMGTTMVMLYFQPGGVLAGHIGDSRYYHIRPATRQILYRSKDHSLVTELYEAGEITREEMSTAQGKNVIMRAVMPNQEQRDMPDFVHIKDVQPGDWFYMCSDGMLEQMSDEEILNVFSDESLTPEQKRDFLVNATADNHDNHTAYLIRVEAVEHDEVDAAAIDDEMEARAANRVLADVDAAMAQDAYVPEPEPVVEPLPGYDAAPGCADTAPDFMAPHPNPVPRPSAVPQKAGNGKLYGIIGVLIAVIIILLLLFIFVFNKKADKQDKSLPKAPMEWNNGHNQRNEDMDDVKPADVIRSNTSARPAATQSHTRTDNSGTITAPTTASRRAGTTTSRNNAGTKKFITDKVSGQGQSGGKGSTSGISTIGTKYDVQPSSDGTNPSSTKGAKASN